MDESLTAPCPLCGLYPAIVFDVAEHFIACERGHASVRVTGNRGVFCQSLQDKAVENWNRIARVYEA